MRKRSTTAARLQRAFSAKGLRSPATNNGGVINENNSSDPPITNNGYPNSPVQNERHNNSNSTYSTNNSINCNGQHHDASVGSDNSMLSQTTASTGRSGQYSCMAENGANKPKRQFIMETPVQFTTVSQYFNNTHNSLEQS